ncbi:hypothetical protein BDV95DRAFT_670276 [Massariosphaeria phaeospora]|uniref:Uncharacterized protein n=1 Tax=Massariosphaeria phaeospora TaxID=100035 RepID=A0A7C8I6U7_9PLEO|nr:hypothetical protein BDV95DRAFT_670276 [Massariosphaeria phaeospora]
MALRTLIAVGQRRVVLSRKKWWTAPAGTATDDRRVLWPTPTQRLIHSGGSAGEAFALLVTPCFSRVAAPLLPTLCLPLAVSAAWFALASAALFCAAGMQTPQPVSSPHLKLPPFLGGRLL